MSPRSRVPALFIVILSITSLTKVVTAFQVVFDHTSDIYNLIDISCAYTEDYADFWVYGCPTRPSHDIYPELTGFWTACKTKCSLIYDGGQLPKAEKVLISLYIEGDTYVTIEGKNRSQDSGIHYYGYIDAQEEPGWCTKEIDSTLGGTGNMILNFTVTSSPKGFVLIDKIIMDFGEQDISLVTLDVKEDELQTHWAYDDCHYVDDYKDFWVYGCPVEPLVGNPYTALGYWSPCNENKCRIQYATHPDIIPQELYIRYYIEGDAEILVTRTTPGMKTATNYDPTIITRLSASEGDWMEFSFTSLNAYRIDVTLVRNGGTAMLDFLRFNFTKNSQEELEFRLQLPTCIANQLTTTTSTTAVTVTNTTPSPSSTTTPPSSTNTPITSTSTSTNPPCYNSNNAGEIQSEGLNNFIRTAFRDYPDFLRNTNTDPSPPIISPTNLLMNTSFLQLTAVYTNSVGSGMSNGVHSTEVSSDFLTPEFSFATNFQNVSLYGSYTANGTIISLYPIEGSGIWEIRNFRMRMECTITGFAIEDGYINLNRFNTREVAQAAFLQDAHVSMPDLVKPEDADGIGQEVLNVLGEAIPQMMLDQGKHPIIKSVLDYLTFKFMVTPLSEVIGTPPCPSIQ